MSRFSRHILSAAFTVICGCASSESTGTSSTPDAGAADPPPAQSGLSDPKVVAKLRDMGLQASSRAGVPLPKTMVAVAASDEQAAEMALTGGFAPRPLPVFINLGGGGAAFFW